MSHSSIEHAKISWNDAGTPVSNQFDDVYFSNVNGLEETRYVFLQQNQLPERWHQHSENRFVIAETGFGTGLNFLATWQAFTQHLMKNPNATTQYLHFISFEKFPVTPSDLTKAHAAWPELEDFATQLRENYPIATPGCHRLILAQGRVTLDLWFGDIHDNLPQVWVNEIGIVDTWYLDGFAPSKNPDMWNQNLFDGMATLAKKDCHLATFTAAGFVRRGLIDAGFNIQKVKGFGSKREMLSGTLTERTEKLIARSSNHQMPWFYREPAEQTDDIALIGGGIASACLVMSLIQRGKNVTLYCEDAQPAQGASGNRQGAVYPLLAQPHEPLSQFFAPAFVFARQFIKNHASDIEFDHQWCGVTHLGWNEKTAFKLSKMCQAGFPEDLVKALDPKELNEVTGLDIHQEGLSYPFGGWLSPQQLTQGFIQKAIDSGLLKVHYNTRIEQLSHDGQSWSLKNATQTFRHQCVVIANGHQFSQFEQTAPIPAYAVRGQVTHIQTTPVLQKLKTVLCYEGYLTPVNSKTQTHCIGASYWRNDEGLDFRKADQIENKQKLINSLPDSAHSQEHWAHAIDIDHTHARVGIRTASRDHLPFVGNVCHYSAMRNQYANLKEQQATAGNLPIYPQLYCFLALGSRGLTSAPLAAECLAAQLCHEPLPLAKDVLNALHPARLWIRKLLKGKAISPSHDKD